MSAGQYFIWPWWVRLCHWALVLVFVANYFVLDPGSDLHAWLGYGITALLLLRIARGFSALAGYAAFSHCDLRSTAFKHHWRELKGRRLSPAAGHNPLGWLMVFFIWFLVIVLAVTGFLAEEVDYFWGNQLLDSMHLWAADAMLVAALIHIAAVVAVGAWGRISLIKPMLVGVRKVAEKTAGS